MGWYCTMKTIIIIVFITTIHTTSTIYTTNISTNNDATSSMYYTSRNCGTISTILYLSQQ